MLFLNFLSCLRELTSLYVPLKDTGMQVSTERKITVDNLSKQRCYWAG